MTNALRCFRPLLVPLAVSVVLAGCASYRARPLVLVPPLRTSLAALDRALPDGRMIAVDAPLTPQAVAALAVLNDPALAVARARLGVERAKVFAAGLIPDPNVQGGFGALLGGPGVAPSVAGSISQDIAALITRGARVRAARARQGEAVAAMLWQEFQVASQAETLASALWADRAGLAALDRARAALRAQVEGARRQVAAGTVTLDQASAAEASLAGLDATRDGLAQQDLTDRAALAAVLGVVPDVSIRLARPVIPRVATDGLVASLADRRPDLIALRYGYQAADADLRAAILARFPLLALSVNGGSDTSRVATAGPTISLNLPVFNGNRGNVAVARATRRQLDAAFTAALAAAQGGALAARRALGVLDRQREAARARVRLADRAVRAARGPYRAGLIDARVETDLIDQQALRRAELIALDHKIAAGRIALATLLGAGLPVVSIRGGAR
ncbi:TolC family protein [Acidiphilium acidophilum]|uniref:TolC family protein n=1 Tax=Acidiphilium acidophilum TaxID=76588 RepID=A0AAW9DVW1_ACIAO|nr:TolC family protein [Acidiphilium acidophilum]MDX5932270.1 TolC family protein [Acidiphilium acidophilum]